MDEKEKEMWEWLDKEHCPKCGLNEIPEDSPFYHCEECRNQKYGQTTDKGEG